MDLGRSLPRPALFLGAFTPAAGLLLWAWSYVSGLYLAALTAAVNHLLLLTGAPLALQVPSLSGSGMAYPGIAGGIALFAVTPSRSAGWRLRWLVLLAGLLGALHTAVFYLDAQLAMAQHAGSGSPITAFLAHVAEMSKSWGTSTLVLATWFRAVRLGDRHGSRPNRGAPPGASPARPFTPFSLS